MGYQAGKSEAMKNIIITLILMGGALSVGAQVNNIYRTAGVAYTIGPPTFRPGASGTRFAVDTVTMLWYESLDINTGDWIKSGHRIQEITGCAAPGYVPTKHQSPMVINACDSLYNYRAGVWHHLNPVSTGGGGAIVTDATIDGIGTGGDPLKIGQQGAATSEVLAWTGATWEPSWGNPYTFVTSGSTITTAVNEVLIGTLSASITIGLPSCSSINDSKHFKFIRNGSDTFSVTIDPSSTEAFYDGSLTKIIFGKIAIDCTCRFSGGTGVWFVDNL